MHTYHHLCAAHSKLRLRAFTACRPIVFGLFVIATLTAFAGAETSGRHAPNLSQVHISPQAQVPTPKIEPLQTALFTTVTTDPFSAIRAHYAAHVYQSYRAAAADAENLRARINDFLQEPNTDTLAKSRNAWRVARDSYSQTEAFRFYEGPIDGTDRATGVVGPETRLNSWPINEAYIDYVVGHPRSGLIADHRQMLSAKALARINQTHDEADISTGYHAIEFLLWGQDLFANSAGRRPASDYAPIPENQRRRDYLYAVTQLLIDDLNLLVVAWAPAQNNYAQWFITQPGGESDILTGLATLSEFEMAAERLGAALDSGDQEDEQSCFSDNSLRDLKMNQKGIEAAFSGSDSMMQLLRVQNPHLAEAIATQFRKIDHLLLGLPEPFDQAILASPENSPARQRAEELVLALQEQALLFQDSGRFFGLTVHMMSD